MLYLTPLKVFFVSEWQLLKKIQKNTLRYRLLSRVPFPIISTKFSDKDKGDNSWLQIKHKKKTYILRYVDAQKKIFPHPIISWCNSTFIHLYSCMIRSF